jgi:hypothetical protein
MSSAAWSHKACLRVLRVRWTMSPDSQETFRDLLAGNDKTEYFPCSLLYLMSDSPWGRLLDRQNHLETNGQMYTCPRRAACIAGIRCALMWDFRTYPKAPSAMHAIMNCSSGWIVRNTILAGNEDSRSQRAASIPFKTGIVMSATMTSGQRRRASDTNVAPSVAVPTMSN